MKRKLARYLSGMACLVFAALIGLSAKEFSVIAENGTAETLLSYLPKTDKAAPVGTEANPFTVLDIVPNKSMGMMGYMIPGCEPVDMAALAGDFELRSDFQIDLIDSGIFSGGEDSYAYAFYDGLPDGAEITDDIFNYHTAYGKWCKFDNEASPGYSEYGYYENVGAGNGSYDAVANGDIPVFSPQEGGSYVWVKTGYYYPAENGAGGYQRSGDAASGYTFVEAENGPFAYQAVEGSFGTEEWDLNTCYWTVKTDAAYYRYLYYGYQNMDVMIPYSFEGASSYNGFVSQVITVTPDQLTDENLGVIADADLICFSAQEYTVKYWEKYNKGHETLTETERKTTEFTGAAGNDLSWNTVLAIIERMASDSPAAMILQFDKMCGSGEYNIDKLYMMLMQYGAKPFHRMFLADTENFKAQEVTVDGRTFVTGAYRNPEKPDSGFVTAWDKETFKTSLGVSVMHESDFPQGQSEVFGTILTTNGDQSLLREFLNPNKIGEVKQNGNEWYKLGTNSEVFDFYQELYGTRPGAISMNQATKYILGHASGAQSYRKKLHVLELQPCNQFIYGNYGWQLFYMNLFPWFTGDLEEDLRVTTMTTYQFIGDITDLNAEYDLILIGGSQDGSNGLYGYQDGSMNTGEWENGYKKGLIYTAIGDLVTTKDGSWSSAGTGAWSDGGSDAYQLKTRYSGNDLTKKKFEEIKDYMQSGSPVVVSRKLYSGTQMDKSKVDASSYLYQLGALTYQPGKNESMLFLEENYRDSLGYDRLKGALKKNRCRILFAEDGSGYPVPYSAETEDGSADVLDDWGNTVNTAAVSGLIKSEQYHTLKDGNGNPLLRYEFELSGDDAYTYGVKLYIDRNGDGIFANSIKELREAGAAGKETDALAGEELSGLHIEDITGGEAYGVEDMKLLPGHRYVVTRSIPSSERGILPWKLEVYAHENESVRSSVKNEFALPAADSKRKGIRVLQMNLRPDMSENGNTAINFADRTTVAGAKLHAYLQAVGDFDVQLEFMKNADWYDAYGEDGLYAKQSGAGEEDLVQKWEDYLEEIDMLVLGFSGSAAFTEDEIFYEGFLDFVNQGKSVILSSDVVKDASYTYLDPSSVTEYDAEIRTLAGMRRKYYVTPDGTNPHRNYYRYSSAGQMGSTLGLVLNDSEAASFNQHMHNGIKHPYEAYVSEAGTNIPDGTGGYTAGDQETYEKNGQEYYLDLAGEFMDNSVRLLMSYAKDADRRDRVLGPEQSIEWSSGARTERVSIANRGQITNYPYVLGDTLAVSGTWAGNFQLDLEQEDGGDVTVWYHLDDAYEGTGVYSSRPGDARNSFYTYTKGNITYTGMGRSAGDALTDDELKLFVNTLVGAYRAAPEKPHLKITNEDASVHDDIYTMYVMMTGDEKDTDSLEIDFTVVDESLMGIVQKNYYLQYQGQDGEALAAQPDTVAADGSRPLFLTDKNSYAVAADGKYSFSVPYKEILENGKAEYFLELRSEYMTGGKLVETRKVTKAVIYAMPLFSLH